MKMYRPILRGHSMKNSKSRSRLMWRLSEYCYSFSTNCSYYLRCYQVILIMIQLMRVAIHHLHLKTKEISDRGRNTVYDSKKLQALLQYIILMLRAIYTLFRLRTENSATFAKLERFPRLIVGFTVT